MSAFERVFGAAVVNVQLDGAAEQRLAANADEEEWRLLRERAKVAAEQVCRGRGLRVNVVKGWG